MIAVTGATGFVGREVLRQGLSLGTPLRALVRSETAIPGIMDVRVVGDLTNPLPAGSLAHCDVVIHCAARAHVLRERESDPESVFLRANCDAAISVAEAAAVAGVKRFVFVSTIKVLGTFTPPGESFAPGDMPAPSDAYARSKAAAERELKALAMRTGLEVVIVRPPLVHGGGAKGYLARLVSALRLGVPLPFGAIENRRSLVHVENLADLLLEAATHPLAAGLTVHAADDEALSTREIAQQIAMGLGVKARFFNVSPTLLRNAGKLLGMEGMVARLTDSLVVDTYRTEHMLDWRPRVRVRDGLRRMGELGR